MSRTIRILLCGAAVSVLGSASTRAQEARTSPIKGGTEGKVSQVDVEKGTLTIARESGREQTFTITNDTTIVGPRGGVVHRRLRDHRFHKGLPVTVVAEGDVATEVHLGFDRKTQAGSPAATRAGSGASTEGTEQPAPPSGTRRTTRFRGLFGSKSENETEKSEPAAEEDTDFPGKVKHADPARHLLVITLLNGKDRSFMLSHDVKFTHNGRTMRQGLADAMVKPGASVTVITEEGGRKVKEVKVLAVTSRRLRSAG